jgi:hypothetical protein
MHSYRFPEALPDRWMDWRGGSPAIRRLNFIIFAVRIPEVDQHRAVLRDPVGTELADTHNDAERQEF